MICELAVAITNYENSARQLDPSLVDRVLDLYFTKLEHVPGAPEPSTLVDLDPHGSLTSEPQMVEPQMVEQQLVEPTLTTPPPAYEDLPG